MSADTPEATGNDSFIAAAENVKNLKSKPSDNDMLQLYALYKQSIFGDNNTEYPGVFDLKGKAKWNAWDALKGTAKPVAQKKYVELVENLTANI